MSEHSPGGPPPPAAPPLGDMDAAAFREAGHELVDRIARYLEEAERYPVLSRVKPGEVRGALPTEAPPSGEPWSAIRDDVERLIVPGLTSGTIPGSSPTSPSAPAAPACSPSS